ncbi:MAG: GNAT family N-acetyltransferase [Treponemataceae bacterium]|nr:GNAT family N-acetyltransferase [Treponemataceae bacterium]
MLIPEETFTAGNGKPLEIRSVTAEYALQLAQHRTATSRETYFMARYPEECRIDLAELSETVQCLEDSETEFAVTAFDGETIVGDLCVRHISSHIKTRHRYGLGISIRQEFCGLGLGSRMLQIAVETARKNGIEQLELGVFADNPRAIALYEKYGFKEWGRQPHAFKLKDGTYRDEIMMVLFLDQAD